MREDRTGWMIVFDGTIYGSWGREILPARDSHPSEFWSTTSPRKYTKSGRYNQGLKTTYNEQSQRSAGVAEEYHDEY